MDDAMDDDARARLEAFLASAALANEARVLACAPLSGGAIQENWALDVEFCCGPHSGTQALVLRTDAPSGVGESRSRAEEFALLKAAAAVGVRVPEPLWLCREPAVLGRAFFVMRRVSGETAGHKLVRGKGPAFDGAALTRQLGIELARLHTVTPPRRLLDFLALPEPDPAAARLGEMRTFLDRHPQPRPVLEWGLRRLEITRPPPGEVVLCHRDFRTGNYMVDATGLVAVLDWEFAAWSDPFEDLGWLCAKCWRFGNDAMEAGGIGRRADLYDAYAEAAGRLVDAARVAWWETFAHIRWAIIALQQAERHVSGVERSLELALTAHVVPELEREILRRTAG